ncbi:MAG TPA: class I SAM-dependent methyltransferase [Chloroflexota bacterium]|nr:class I SAM-dependent methyltransferase [Chloroflexota bacterium]
MTNLEDAVAKQLAYYRDTAWDYDVHLADEEHNVALKIIGAYVSEIGAASVLDTGCGTGRGVKYLVNRFPAMRVHGNDPSPDLLQVARDRHGLSEHILTCCSSYNLPFADGEFDVVIELGMLHHVEYPNRVVSEMLRVARRAIFISDSNRFGQGSVSKRLIKLGLHSVGLWPIASRLQHGGKKYYSSKGDGIAFSYSAYDSWPVLAAVCKETFVIPTTRSKWAPWCPLLFARHVLVAGIKQGLGVRD